MSFISKQKQNRVILNHCNIEKKKKTLLFLKFNYLWTFDFIVSKTQQNSTRK
jgi:hypothetical protein